MTTRPLYKLVIWLVILACVYGCALNSSSTDKSIAANRQRLNEHHGVLQQQTKALNNIALSQSVLAKTLKNIQSELVSARTKPERLNNLSQKKDPSEVQSIRLMANSVKNSKITIGRNEWVWIDLVGQTFKARVDTGALSSAIHATSIQPFERNGKKWVRFTLSNEDNAKQFARPLIRYVQVRHSSTEQLDRRPVITLTVRMGDIVEETEFTLNNRAKMLYPVLLGRDFLRDIVIVDVAKKFTQSKYKAKTLQE